MICLFVVCCLFLGVAVAQPNETLYVDSEWIVPANVTSDGSIERPFLNLSGVADTITDWAMQGLDMLAVTVHLAPRLYSGPANCFQMLNLLVMAEFELHGAWTNGSTLGGNLLDSATFECVNTAPRNTRQLTWLGLFGARDRFVMSDVTFRRSRATCASAWLTYDVTLDDPAPSPHPPVPLLRCMPYIGLPRVICGGVVLSTAQHRNGTDVTFRRVHFHDNVVNVTAPLQGNLVVAERKAHSPLMVLARGFSTSCDSVTVTESTFLNNTLEIVVYPTSSTAVFSGNFRTYGAVGGGALTVSGGDLVAVNCTFFGNTARIALASLLLITARQPSRLYFNVVAGGALMIDYGRGAVIANSTFANNTAASFRSGGGAIALRWSDEVPVEVRRNQLAPSVLVVNSVLANNSANDGSMGAVDWESLPFNSSHDADHAVVWESLGGALAAGLVWPNSTRKFVVVGVSLRNCTVTANSVFAVVVGRQPSCFGGAVMAASVIVENSLLADNSAACEDASGGAIETEIARAQDSAFVGNTVSSLVPFGSAGGSFSNRKLLAIDAEVCGDTVWSVLGCSFAANASDTPGDEELERVVGAAVMIDAQCMPRQFMLQNTSFVGFRAATIFEVTADRLLLDTASVVDCSGSFVFHMHDLVDNFGIMASINVTNSTAQFGPLIDLSAATVKLNVVATNVTMQNDAIVKVTARYAKVYPQFDNCDCLSSFACDATAIDVAILGGATSTVEMLDGVFRRVRGKSVVRMIQIAEHNYTGLSVTNVQVLECEVGSAVVFETHMEQSAATILHHTITLDDSVVANNAIANSVVRHVGAGRVTPGSLGMINGTVAGNRAFTTKDVAVFEMLVLDRFAGAIDITGSTAPGVLVKECVFRDNVGVAVARGALLTTMRSLFVNNTVSGSLLGTFRGWALINVTETTFRHNVGALLHASAAGLPADKVPPRILFDSVNVFDHASDFPLIELSLPAMNASLLLFDVTFDSVVLDDSLAMAYNVSELVVVRSVFRNVSAAPLASTCGGSLFIGYCDSVLIENTAFLNSSAAFGGAVCVGRTASLIQSNLTFANNRARVGADVFYVSADVARAVDANLTVAPTRASVASSVSLSGFERGVMSGVPVDLTFAMRDVFGRAPAAHQERPVSMARFAVDLATVNCTHDHSDVSFLCVISESDHECVARVAFVGAPDTECALNYTVRPIDAAQPRALAAVGGAPTLTGASLMSIVPCAIGFGATLSENGTTACEPCSPGTYNVDASVQRCFACVNERLFCAGRNLVTAQDGYWARRLGDGSILTLMCDADVCLAGTPGRDLSRCVAGRTGVLCALCTEPSFTPVAPKDGVSCIECRGVSWPLVVAASPPSPRWRSCCTSRSSARRRASKCSSSTRRRSRSCCPRALRARCLRRLTFTRCRARRRLAACALRRSTAFSCSRCTSRTHCCSRRR
jgi:hypothetical protein